MTPAAATAARADDRPVLRAVPGSSVDFRARLAQVGLSVDGLLRHADLVVDLPAYVVTRGDEVLDLSARQVELLALFLLAPGRVWSRDQLNRMCWEDAAATSRRVDVQLCRLRAKTGMDLFRNVRDRGWALRPAG